MSAAWRHLAKRVVPRRARRALRLWFGWKWFEGRYRSWEDARAHCTGYEDPAIAARVRAATILVRDEKAAFERDGLAFPQPTPEPTLLESFAAVACSAAGRPIRVTDFGGSLGTTYWRHRAALRAMADWRWRVVEQPEFVRIGSAEFTSDELQFFASIDAAEQASGGTDVLFASTVLQYLPDPHAILRSWAERRVPWILFNNLPLQESEGDRIAVQHVPPSLSAGERVTYPVWFFNRGSVLAGLGSAYRIEREFVSEAEWPVDRRWYPSTGLLLRRVAPASSATTPA